jgi:hypothetical protein
MKAVLYENRKRIVIHHFGSAHSDEAPNNLIRLAEICRIKKSPTILKFPRGNPRKVTPIETFIFSGR